MHTLLASMQCVDIDQLTFSYDNVPFFQDLSLKLYTNECYVLSGLNGCGKSSLLKILGGKVLCSHDKVRVFGKDPFRDTSSNQDILFVNNEWGNRTVAYSGYDVPLQSSLQVKDMMVKLKETYPERNTELLRVLGVNPEWHLNGVSEGQRKRVQLYLNLLHPFRLCLLDEITVNLDLLVKHRLMEYLKKETQERQCCIVYVTHIFDGLENWATQLVYMRKDKGLELHPMGKIDNLYRFLLTRFQKEESAMGDDDARSEEKEDKPLVIGLKNAGGYSHGVLGSYNVLENGT